MSVNGAHWQNSEASLEDREVEGADRDKKLGKVSGKDREQENNDIVEVLKKKDELDNEKKNHIK